MKSVYVYDDDGVGTESLSDTLIFFGESAKRIDSNEVISGDWHKDAGLFVMPGGEDIPYHRKLRGVGNDKIRRYVLSGGTYLGICAGAYYACREIEFARGLTGEVICERELKFFPGKAIGPALGSPGWIRVGGAEFWWNKGPYFKDAACYGYVSVLGKYSNGEAAIVEIEYGLGRAVLSGVHFEKVRR